MAGLATHSGKLQASHATIRMQRREEAKFGIDGVSCELEALRARLERRHVKGGKGGGSEHSTVVATERAMGLRHGNSASQIKR